MKSHYLAIAVVLLILYVLYNRSARARTPMGRIAEESVRLARAEAAESRAAARRAMERV
jgi:hypothetical protein